MGKRGRTKKILPLSRSLLVRTTFGHPGMPGEAGAAPAALRNQGVVMGEDGLTLVNFHAHRLSVDRAICHLRPWSQS